MMLQVLARLELLELRVREGFVSGLVPSAGAGLLPLDVASSSLPGLPTCDFPNLLLESKSALRFSSSVPPLVSVSVLVSLSVVILEVSVGC